MQSQLMILDTLDQDLVNRLTSRRELFGVSATKLAGLATAPLILAAVSTEAFGQQMPKQVVDVLNFALTLEYLESEFYSTALAVPSLIPAEFAAVFAQISKHETAHVATLKGALGSEAVAKPEFDFTGRGKYRDVMSNFKTFAAVAQTFEDTGVAAYKGQAGNLAGAGKVLTIALQIHSVEARHAAEVRRVRGVKAWTGAFDKPMTKAQVLAIAKPFIVG